MLKIHLASIWISKVRNIALAILLYTNLSIPQTHQEPADTSGFFDSKTISMIAVSGVYLGSLIDSYFIWWRDDRRDFSVMNSSWFNEYSEYGIDKLGHFYTSYFFFKFQKNLFLLGGYSDETSDLLSGSLTLSMAVIIEVSDGFSRYGFDSKDLISNIGGLGYAYAQEKIPVLNNFNFKWSFFPSGGWQFPPRFSDHYDGHIYWLSFNIAGLLPETTSIWPSFLHPAIGYSVGDGGSRREFIAGLDLDLYSLIKSDNKYVDFIGKTLNLVHIPMPGIKIYEDRKPDYKLLLLN